MVHETRLGWMWDANKEQRKVMPIPPQLRLTKEEVLEMYPKNDEQDAQRTITRNEYWVRNYGIAMFFKRDGVWYSNIPQSSIKGSLHEKEISSH